MTEFLTRTITPTGWPSALLNQTLTAIPKTGADLIFGPFGPITISHAYLTGRTNARYARVTTDHSVVAEFLRKTSAFRLQRGGRVGGRTIDGLYKG
jgi:hypothetical protein